MKEFYSFTRYEVTDNHYIVGEFLTLEHAKEVFDGLNDAICPTVTKVTYSYDFNTYETVDVKEEIVIF